MSPTTKTSVPGLGPWIAMGSLAGLVFGVPLGVWLLEYPPALFVALILVPGSLLLAGMVRNAVTAFIAAAVVTGFLVCLVGVVAWITSLGSEMEW